MSMDDVRKHFCIF